MNLIMMRVNANLPVILKGEAGCGKTYLIKFLVENLLEEKLHILNIHSGINTEYIKTKISEINNEAE
jgi:MoxR-like ATPase